MTTEAYIPQSIQLATEPLADVFVLTLHDPDGETPHGSLTTHHPLPEGTRAGPLVLTATRDGQTWQLTLPEIEVYRQTPVGCEFNIFGRVQRRRHAAPVP